MRIALLADIHGNSIALDAALDAARGIGGEWARTRVLSAVAGRLPPEDSGVLAQALFNELSETLCAFSRARREQMIRAIKALVPVLARLGGERALRETAQAIVDTGRWWP